MNGVSKPLWETLSLGHDNRNIMCLQQSASCQLTSVRQLENVQCLHIRIIYTHFGDHSWTRTLCSVPIRVVHVSWINAFYINHHKIMYYFRKRRWLHYRIILVWSVFGGPNYHWTKWEIFDGTDQNDSTDQGTMTQNVILDLTHLNFYKIQATWIYKFI